MPNWFVHSEVDSITTAMFALAFAEAVSAELVVGEFGEDDLPKVSSTKAFWPSELFTNHKPTEKERAEAIYGELPIYRGIRLASSLSATPDTEKVIAIWSKSFRVVSIQPNNLLNSQTIWLLPDREDVFQELSSRLTSQPPFGVVLFGDLKSSALKHWRAAITDIPIVEFKPQAGVKLALQSGFGIPYSSSVFRAAKGIAA